MLKASLYIAFCSAKNRTALRLRRLREPRYMVGAALATVYFIFIFAMPRGAGRRRRGGGRDLPEVPALGAYAPQLTGAALMLLSAAAWLLPARSHLLTFTEAEVSFLFPAPVSRRQLLVHRIIRAQLGLLFAAIVPVFLVAFPGATTSTAERLLFGIALWIALATTRVYFAGVTMARDHLSSPSARARRAAWAPLLVTIGAFAVAAVPLARAMPTGLPSLPDVLAALDRATVDGLPRAALMPFMILLGPMFADGLREYLVALAGSLAVLLATLAWVIKSDEVFHTTGADPVTPPAVARRGRIAASPTLRWSGWSLPPGGRVETVFFWKNGLETLRTTNTKSLVPIALLVAYAVVGTMFGMSTGFGPALCMAALMAAAFATLLGPGSVMGDLRGDLRHMEVLKTWPVKGAAVVRGEMLWPGALVTSCAWVALSVAMVLSGSAFPQVPLTWRFTLYAVAVVLVPAFVLAQYTVHQAAAVLFPAWVPTDNQMRGFESMAQRLILFAGVVLALMVMIGPGAIAGGIVAFAFYSLTGNPLVLVPGAMLCLAVVVIEVVLASEALGPAYERIDLSGVERSE